MTDKEYITSIIATEIYQRFVDAQIDETIKIFNRISFEELLQIEANKDNDNHSKIAKFVSFTVNYIATKVTAAFNDACEHNDSGLSDNEKSIISVIITLTSGAYKNFTDDEMNKFYDDFNSLSYAVRENIGVTYDKELTEFIKFNFEKRKAFYSSFFGSESAARTMMGIDD